jgi:hypothetical protein
VRGHPQWSGVAQGNPRPPLGVVARPPPRVGGDRSGVARGHLSVFFFFFFFFFFFLFFFFFFNKFGDPRVFVKNCCWRGGPGHQIRLMRMLALN